MSLATAKIKYLKIVNLFLSALPFLFGICLCSIFYRNRNFSVEEASQKLRETNYFKVTSLFGGLVFLGILPNLICLFVLCYSLYKIRKSIYPYILIYVLGLALLFYIFQLDDDINALRWFLG